MLHVFWHLNSLGPLPAIMAGALWHSNMVIDLTGFGFVVWILGKRQ
jgi:hypothetical protein